jgi:hypothetical protein
MSEEPDSAESSEVPDGAAVFPEIPDELGVHPLLLAVLHATVFLAGSTDEVVDGPAADEAVQGMANYLGRLDGPDLARVRQDLDCLVAFARQAQWPRELVRFLKSFLADYGIDEGEGADE